MLKIKLNRFLISSIFAFIGTAYVMSFAVPAKASVELTLTASTYDANANDAVTFNLKVDRIPSDFVKYDCAVYVAETPDTKGDWRQISKDVTFTSMDDENDQQCSANWTIEPGTPEGNYWFRGAVSGDDTDYQETLNYIHVNGSDYDDSTSNSFQPSDEDIGYSGTSPFSDDQLSCSVSGLGDPDFYDLNDPPTNQTITFNGHFDTVDPSYSYKAALYISYQGASDQYYQENPVLSDASASSLLGNWWKETSPIPTYPGTFSYDFSIRKTFNNDAATGYHDVIMRIYKRQNATDAQPIEIAAEQRIPFYIGKCKGTSWCDNPLTVKVNGSNYVKYLRNTGQSNPTVNVIFDVPSDISSTVKYTAHIYVSTNSTNSMNNSLTGDPSATDWQDYKHEYTKPGNDTFSLTVSLDRTTPVGFRQIAVKVFKTVNGTTLKPYFRFNWNQWIEVRDNLSLPSGGSATTPPKPPGNTTVNLSIPKILDTTGNIFKILYSSIIKNWLVLAISIGALASIIYAGFLFLTAAGDEKNIEKAKKTFLYTIVGVIVAVFSYNIIRIVVSLLKQL